MHTLEQVSTFIAVYEQGSYSAAAKQLGKSRTTVREHIMAFEDGVGFTLFSIEGRKAIPTDKAVQLYFRARVVEKQNRELFQYSQALFDSELHTLTIAHDVFVPLNLMVETERAIREVHPAIKINWLHRTRQEALAMLKAGEADLALMPSRDRVFAETEVAWKTLGHLQLKCFSGVHSPLADMSSVTLGDLQSETQYITENFLGLDVSYAKVSSKLHVVSNTDLLCELVKRDGWAVMPHECMQPFVAAGQLVELRLDAIASSKMIGLNVFYLPGKETHPVIGDVVEQLVALGRKLLV